MKLQNKLVFYNTFSKIIIILSIGIIIPRLIQDVIYDHTDARLKSKRVKMMDMIRKGGIREITHDEDCSFGNYNILKEEFIAVEPLKTKPTETEKIENAKRDIEGEIITHRVLSHAFFYDNQYYLLEIGRDLSTIQELNLTVKRFTIFMLIIVISLSILIDFGFIRLTLIPFNRIIQKKLRTVKHPTTFDTRPVKTSTDDFKYLDQSLNEMMLKIKDVFLVEKEFIANVSHELLTPISVLQGKFENMLLDESIPEKMDAKIVDALKTLNRMTRIIKALLLISKVENAQYAKTDVVEIGELLDDVTEGIEERLTEKEIEMKTSYLSRFSLKDCNRDLLYQLFFNVINNAIKYNKPQGKIYISTYEDPSQHIVEIKDTGIGIEEASLPSVFNRFRKLDNEDKDSHGLGLPIVRTIANFHNADIDIKSEPGTGTSFRLLFPKSESSSKIH
jgi:signal transduction histidine kinase